MQGCGWNFAALTDCFHFTSLNIYINIFCGFSPVINFSSPLARSYCSLLLIYFSSRWSEPCGSLLWAGSCEFILRWAPGMFLPKHLPDSITPRRPQLSVTAALVWVRSSAWSSLSYLHMFLERRQFPYFHFCGVYLQFLFKYGYVWICWKEANPPMLWTVGNSLQVIRFKVSRNACPVPLSL